MKYLTTILGLVFVLGCAAGIFRAYKQYQTPSQEFDRTSQGFCDFHNGTYFPVLAFSKGENPYGGKYSAEYPVSRPLPLFSPTFLVTHLPLAWLDLRTAEVVQSISTVLIVLLLCCIATLWSRDEKTGDDSDSDSKPNRDNKTLAINVFLGSACLIVFSRCGHLTLFTGYFTMELALGTVLALWFPKRNPWLAALGLVLASAKPTYFFPLAILMACRGHYRAVILGLVILVVVGSGSMAWMSVNGDGLSDTIQGMREGQHAHIEDPTEHPVQTWTRVDLMAMVSKWMGWNPSEMIYLGVMFVLLIPPAIAVYRMRGTEDAQSAIGLSAMVIYLSIMVTIYHQIYDILPLVAVALGFVFLSPPSNSNAGSMSIGKWHRLAIAGMVLAAAFNYTATRTFMGKLNLDGEGIPYAVITTVSAFLLFSAWVYSIILAFQVSSKMKQEQLSAG